MTIDKATEIIDLNIKEVGSEMPPDVLIALKMARGGLLVIKGLRYAGWFDDHDLLTGESKD